MSKRSSGDSQKSGKKKYPYTTCMIADGHRKFHTEHEDGSEMVEEFVIGTYELAIRKTRSRTALGGEGKWVYEVGAEPPKGFNRFEHYIAPSSSNPVFLRQDTKTSFCWRVRNCPWEASVYVVTVDSDSDEIVIRTTNRKYFKRFSIPDLRRAKIPLAGSQVSFEYSNRTLIVTYPKPPEIRRRERAMIEAQKKMDSDKKPRDGDVQCPSQ